MKKKIYGTLKSIKEICGLNLVELKYEDCAIYSEAMNSHSGDVGELISRESDRYDYYFLASNYEHLVKKEWLKDIREEYEFKVDDKVWVRYFNNDDWVPRYFAKSENSYAYCWDNGRTSFSTENNPLTKWVYCIPHLHDGYNPNNEETK